MGHANRLPVACTGDVPVPDTGICHQSRRRVNTRCLHWENGKPVQGTGMTFHRGIVQFDLYWVLEFCFLFPVK